MVEGEDRQKLQYSGQFFHPFYPAAHRVWRWEHPWCWSCVGCLSAVLEPRGCSWCQFCATGAVPGRAGALWMWCLPWWSGKAAGVRCLQLPLLCRCGTGTVPQWSSVNHSGEWSKALNSRGSWNNMARVQSHLHLGSVPSTAPTTTEVVQL